MLFPAEPLSYFTVLPVASFPIIFLFYFCFPSLACVCEAKGRLVNPCTFWHAWERVSFDRYRHV